MNDWSPKSSLTLSTKRLEASVLIGCAAES
jgi:hypothetical protein